MPKVSVIMPSYNHEKYIGEAIQSILDQTFRNYEFLILDDGSRDQSPAKIRQFKDPRIKVFFSEKNMGGAYTNEKLMEKCKGEYIAFFCSDDISLPERLERQVSFMDEHRDIAAVFSHAQIINEDGNDFNDVDHFYCRVFDQPNRNRFEWLRYFFFKANCLCHPSALVRRKLFRAMGLRNPRLAQLPDFDAWIKLCLRYEIHILPERLVKFRVRENEANTSGNRPESRIQFAWERVKMLENYLAISNVGDLLRIFPEAGTRGFPLEKKLIPFVVAQLALEANETYQVFALDTIYKMESSFVLIAIL